LDYPDGHPRESFLRSYALGMLSPGMELLVASHLTTCSRCRRIVEDSESLAGAELSDQPEHDEIKAPCLDAALEALDADDEPAPALTRVDGSILPRPLQRFAPGDLSSIPWSFMMPGLHECVLEGFEDEKVYLLKAKPGTKVMAHTHEGIESTLILQGAMADGERVYRVGDVAEADEKDDHHPHIIGDETCICLVVMSGNLRFTGTFGRALNVFVR